MGYAKISRENKGSRNLWSDCFAQFYVHHFCCNAHLREVKSKYQASVVDYLHVGGKIISPAVSEETFKFWLKEEQREFGVYVRIQFETATERVIFIEFEETER
jgi:hypothetical protein